jgi:hypothetical protein
MRVVNSIDNSQFTMDNSHQTPVTKRANGQFDMSYAFGKDSVVRRFFVETQGSLCSPMRSVVQMGGAFLTRTTASQPGGFPLGESTHPSRTELSTGQSSATIPMVQSCHRIYCRARTVETSYYLAAEYQRLLA